MQKLLCSSNTSEIRGVPITALASLDSHYLRVTRNLHRINSLLPIILSMLVIKLSASYLFNDKCDTGFEKTRQVQSPVLSIQ